MFIDTQKLDQLADHGTDVAIIGAGPAGITLALKLSAKGKSVLLIEAGGFEYPTEEENDPYVGRTVSRPYPLEASRLRYFGGCSNHWGGWVRPLDREDFEANEGIPYSGWPINYDSLAPYYDEAHKICEVRGSEYSPERINGIDQLNLFSFDKDSAFRNSIFRFSPPTRFGDRYRAEIKNSPSVYCALNTQLLHIERGENGKCHLVLLNANKKRVTVHSKRYVLAMGGIENARSLLYSNELNRINLGSDWIGRCFMDHFALTTSRILARTAINYDRTTNSSGDVMGRITPSASMLHQPGFGNLMIDVYPADEDKSLGASYLENPGFFQGLSRGWHYTLRVVTGHRPNRNSRVRLDSELDVNGVPRTILDWNIAEEDFENASFFITKFATTMGATGQGRLKIQIKEPPEISRPLGVGMHHIGTTRMASNHEFGVVDSDCKVFGTSDLYVAGSSIFPTCGYSNPTLTIVALAVRLADHIGEEV